MGQQRLADSTGEGKQGGGGACEGGAGSLGDHGLVNEMLSTTASRVLSPVPTVRTHQALSRGPSHFRHLLVRWAHSSPSHPTGICHT